MMDCLDKNGLHGYYLVIDSAPIQKTATIIVSIERYKCECVHVSSYSPFLGPTKEFWLKVKVGRYQKKYLRFK